MTGFSEMSKRQTSVRLYVDEPLGEGAVVTCNRSQANYLRNVMRLSAGDEILIFDGQSGEWRASLQIEGRNDCRLRVGALVRPQESGPDLHYLFAPLKRARLDYMVQKAVELGVAALRPVTTRRTEVSRINLDRLHANVIEAAEQCGVLRIPTIGEPVALDKLIDQWDSERHIFYCDETADVASPLEVLQAQKNGPVAVLIGPEGGFDPDERDRLRKLPYVTPLSLGPRVMRADTAAVAALALVNAVLGDWH